MERNGYMSLTNAKREDRLIGLDILRILSMVLITLRHYIGYAGLSELTDFFSFNGIAVRMLDILSGSAVNIFVLISGYFLIHSGFKWKRAIKIWGETFFYSVVCFAIAIAFGLEKITSGRLLLSFMPLLSRHYWFTVAYIALYAASPFLNKMLRALNEKEYTVLVVGGAILLSVWTSVIYFSTGVLTGGNTGLLWFIYLYIVGGFIRMHPQKLPKTAVCITGIAGITALLLIYELLADKIGFLNNFKPLEDDSIFELLLSVCIFAVFLRVKIQSSRWSKVIAWVGSCAFGVYLIQESCMLRQWLWLRLVKPGQLAQQWSLIPMAFGVVICLFITAIVGHKLFELLFGLGEKLFSTGKNNKTRQ